MTLPSSIIQFRMNSTTFENKLFNSQSTVDPIFSESCTRSATEQNKYLCCVQSCQNCWGKTSNLLSCTLTFVPTLHPHLKNIQHPPQEVVMNVGHLVLLSNKVTICIPINCLYPLANLKVMHQQAPEDCCISPIPCRIKGPFINRLLSLSQWLLCNKKPVFLTCAEQMLDPFKGWGNPKTWRCVLWSGNTFVSSKMIWKWKHAVRFCRYYL